MRILRDCFGNSIRLTTERLEHIRLHPEMVDLETETGFALESPNAARRPRTDTDVNLFYRFCRATIVGDKWLCVVAKRDSTGAFVVTAYLTDKMKQGEDIWPTQ